MSRDNRIRSLYDPKSFEVAMDAASSELKKYFAKAQVSTSTRHWQEPQVMLDLARSFLDNPILGESENQLPNLTSDAALKLVQAFLDNTHNLHSPHYMGHQVPPPMVVSGVFDMLATATNQAPGLYEMGPLAAMAERAVFQKMTGLIGWNLNDSTAIGTSGGSLANLTAILAARNHRYGNFWREGVSGLTKNSLRPAIIAGQDTHYSIARAAGILGIGADQVISAPVDENHQVDVKALKNIIQTSKQNGLDIFCIVGTAGTTPTGSFDPLEEIGKVAQENKIWFHVDGAHGASVLFSEQHKHLVAGISLADSITWDAHKLLFVPGLSTFLFFRQRTTSYTAFQQDAPYLHDESSPLAFEFDTVSRTVECTKHAVATSLWAMWSLYGASIFEDLINATFERTQEFYNMLEASADFTPLHKPQCNILCFRYLPDFLKNKSDAEISDFQKQLKEKLMRKGEFYTTATRLASGYCLRVTLINPLTETKHLQGLLNAIRELGKSV